MDIYNLFCALRNYNNDNYESLNELRIFSDSIRKNPSKVVSEIDEFVEERALQHDWCPKCLNDTHKRVILNETVEYQAQDVNEPMTEIYCHDCGWSSEDE